MTENPECQSVLGIVTKIDTELSQLHFKLERPLKNGDTIIVIEDYQYDNSGGYIP